MQEKGGIEEDVSSRIKYGWMKKWWEATGLLHDQKSSIKVEREIL